MITDLLSDKEGAHIMAFEQLIEAAAGFAGGDAKEVFRLGMERIKRFAHMRIKRGAFGGACLGAQCDIGVLVPIHHFCVQGGGQIRSEAGDRHVERQPHDAEDVSTAWRLRTCAVKGAGHRGENVGLTVDEGAVNVEDDKSEASH